MMLKLIDHFTLVSLVFQPLSEREAEIDLVLIQIKTSFLFLWKLCLKKTSQHKNDMIYIIKQKGLYQNKVNASFVSTCNCKIGCILGCTVFDPVLFYFVYKINV